MLRELPYGSCTLQWNAYTIIFVMGMVNRDNHRLRWFLCHLGTVGTSNGIILNQNRVCWSWKCARLVSFSLIHGYAAKHHHNEAKHGNSECLSAAIRANFADYINIVLVLSQFPIHPAWYTS